MAERKVVPRGEWAESTRKKQNNWMRENRYKPSTNIPADVGEKFRAWCKSQNKTVSSVLADYIYSIVENPRAATESQAEKTRSTENQTGADAENQAENLEGSAGREG